MIRYIIAESYRVFISTILFKDPTHFALRYTLQKGTYIATVTEASTRYANKILRFIHILNIDARNVLGYLKLNYTFQNYFCNCPFDI